MHFRVREPHLSRVVQPQPAVARGAARLLTVAASLMILSCTVTADLSSKPCPCAAGFVCDIALNRCVADCGACAACQRCTERGCESAEDASRCDGGLCWSGSCCTGCWDGESCLPGDLLSACGSAGAACEACDCAGDSCVADGCQAERQAVALSSGHNHACAALEDSTLWCWGAYDNGQLGSAVTTSFPVSVPNTGGPANWKAAAGGARHSCGLRFDKQILCWGDNTGGQLGQPLDLANSVDPVALGTMQTWLQVAAGTAHTCAIDDGFLLWCWGNNGLSGALGAGCEDAIFPAPQQTAGGGWQTVDSYHRHSCALDDGGSLWCWGSNIDGALGTGDFDDRCVATPVGPSPSSGSTWQGVGVGGFHVCAIAQDGTISCWGGNQHGQLANGFLGAEKTQNSPAAIGPEHYKIVASGRSHSCAIDDRDALWCWGHNDHAQLGSSGADSPSPQPVSPGTRWRQLALGDASSCGVRVTGAVYCWGAGDRGQTGNGEAPDQATPKRVCLTP